MRTGPICDVPLRVLLTKLVNKQVYMTSHSPGLFSYYMLRVHNYQSALSHEFRFNMFIY